MRLAGIPFVGRDMTSSAACMDKVITNVMLEQAGIPQARFTWLYAYEFQSAPDEAVLKIEKDLGGYPVFVKPANAGSSVGVSKAENREELRAAIAKAAKEDGKILIEENIVGQEVECAVLGNEDDLLASTVGEIAPSMSFTITKPNTFPAPPGFIFQPIWSPASLRQSVPPPKRPIRCWAAAAWHGWTSL